MYIRDIYYNDTESLYSVILDEDEMRLYTKYDDTDQLKSSKDSDILAEKKRSNLGSYAKAHFITGGGGALGALGGAGLATLADKKAKKASPNPKLIGAKRGAVGGAIAGLALTGLAAYAAGHKKRKENREYNKRLDYAQTQARRRESKDWSNNMTNRTDYTY